MLWTRIVFATWATAFLFLWQFGVGYTFGAERVDWEGPPMFIDGSILSCGLSLAVAEGILWLSPRLHFEYALAGGMVVVASVVGVGASVVLPKRRGYSITIRSFVCRWLHWSLLLVVLSRLFVDGAYGFWPRVKSLRLTELISGFPGWPARVLLSFVLGFYVAAIAQTEVMWRIRREDTAE